MTRSLSIWGTSVLVLLFLGFAGKTYYPAKPPAQLAMQAASKVAAGHTLSDEVATGDVEDPDRVSLVGPLAVWMRQDEAPDVHKKGHVQWTAQPMDHITVRDQMPEK
ncbi:MAG: hypothetical protein JOZ80_10330, partial [Acidobacteriaceae bacterium]|nr:hypothetical protein [Acidobacteriaceae bacterium]